MKERRKAALESDYELYHNGSDTIIAAAEIDAAVEQAANLAFKKLGDGSTLIDAVHSSLKEIVAPIMHKWRKLGSGDTEPEWNVVYVMNEHIEKRLGFEPHLDGWDMRGCL